MKKRCVLAGLMVIVMLLSGCGVKSAEAYLAEGDYVNAYNNAAEDQKETIYIESLLAFFSNVSAQSLTDRYSFKVLDAYYRESNDENGQYEDIIIYASGSGSNSSDSNKYYMYNRNPKHDWETIGVMSSPDDKYSGSDWGSEDHISFLVASIFLESVLDGSVEDVVRIDTNSINRVNELLATGALDQTMMVENPD